MRCLANITCILAAAVALAAAAPASQVWHVAAGPLPRIPQDRQFRSITAAAKVAEPGDTVVIHDGNYGEAVVIDKSGTRARPIRFEAAPAANVTITGADRLVGWKQEADHVYSIDWPHRFIGWSKTEAHPDDEYHRLIGRAEQVLINGYALPQVLAREQLGRGSFYVDLTAKRLFVCPATDQTLKDGSFREAIAQASTRSILWDCKGDYVQVRGLRFRYAANPAQIGAAAFRGRGDVVEDCIFERTNGIGAVFLGPDQIARRCTFQENGLTGFETNRAHNFLLSGCVVRNNNVKGFNRQWDGGGDKVVLSRDVILENSQFLQNRGPGIWFDIGNENCTVRNCLIADNEGAGIFYEISRGLHAHDNVAVGNGLAPDPPAWGAQAGIVLSSSPECVIERNLLVANQEGFAFREQSRTTPVIANTDETRQEPIWNHDEIIRRNLLAYNRAAQTWGWFATEDERHWPAHLQKEPRALSLEKLRITFANNFYAVADDEGLFNWGVAWSRNERYVDLAQVQRALNLEQGSRAAAIQFANPAARDFRISKREPAARMQCYPRGKIPGAMTGTAQRR